METKSCRVKGIMVVILAPMLILFVMNYLNGYFYKYLFLFLLSTSLIGYCYKNLKKYTRLNNEADILIKRLNKEISENEEVLEAHLEEMSDMYEEISTLYDIGKKIGHIVERDRLLDTILNILVELLDVKAGLIYTVTDNGLEVKKIINHMDIELPVEFLNGIDKGFYLNNIFDEQGKFIGIHEQYFKSLKSENKNYFDALVESPIMFNTDIKGGVILFNKNKGEFTAANLNFLTSLTNQMSISIQNIDFFEKEIERKNEEQQMKIASDIQMRLFPKIMPDFKGVDIHGVSHSAKAVGGDYYDLVVKGDALIGFIADVSGKGIPAALFVSMVRVMFRTIVDQLEKPEPEKILQYINQALLKEDLDGRFVTATCFKIENNVIDISNAGHDPYIYYEKNRNKLSIHPSDEIVLGLMEENYNKKSFKITDGDIFFFYTDGVVEARNEKGDFYEINKLIDSINLNNMKSPEQLIATIENDIKEFMGNVDHQHDDITMLMVKGDTNERT